MTAYFQLLEAEQGGLRQDLRRSTVTYGIQLVRKQPMLIEIDRPPPGGRWWQVVGDVLVPAPVTDFARRVSDERIFVFERIRPYVTRGALLLAICVLFAAMPSIGVLPWVLLIPSAVQVTTEILIEPRVADERAGGALRPSVGRAQRNYERFTLNDTGVLGGVAATLNLVAVCFALGRPEHEWIKVAAYACGVLYMNSGVLGVVLDTTVYSPLQELPGWVRRARQGIWPVLVLVLVGVGVFGADALTDGWPGASLWSAALVSALPFYIGLRSREYDRTLRAAATVAAQAQHEADLGFAKLLHDYLQPFKLPLNRILELDGVTAEEQVSLRSFFADMDALYAQVRSGSLGERSRLVPSVEAVVRRLCAQASVDLTIDTDQLEQALDDVDYLFAKRIVTTLTWNATQAYNRPDNADRVAHLTVCARVTRRESVCIELGDTLDLVPDDLWCVPGSTMAQLRDELQERDGGLVQRPAAGGKTIVVEWRPVLTRLRAPVPGQRLERR